MVNTYNDTIIKTKKRKNYGYRPRAEYVARQNYCRRLENHERLLKNLKRSMCGTSIIKEAKIYSESIMQLPTKSINDFVVEAENLSRYTNSESIMQIPTKLVKDHVIEAENLRRSTNSECNMLIPTKTIKDIAFAAMSGLFDNRSFRKMRNENHNQLRRIIVYRMIFFGRFHSQFCVCRNVRFV